MRICIVYDCLFPHTVGGAERWYRNLAAHLVAEGHDVTYLTLRQWEEAENPNFDGVKVVTVGPRMPLYQGDTRRFWPPIRFGLGVLKHLVTNRNSYDVVHTASFPYFSLLAAGLIAPVASFKITVDWHEVWTKTYWRSYIGGTKGTVGWLVQLLCIKIPHQAYCFSQLHTDRLKRFNFKGSSVLLPGEYNGPTVATEPKPASDYVMFAGRHIPEKNVPLLVHTMVELKQQLPNLKCRIYGDGPQHQSIQQLIQTLALEDSVKLYGFVDSDELEAAMSNALCLVQPSEREGYGMVVIESAAVGTPVVVVNAEDNAASELIDAGQNGYVAEQATPAALATAILKVSRDGHRLRELTAAWFNSNAPKKSLKASLALVVKNYKNSSAN